MSEKSENSICPKRWHFPDIRINTNQVRMCCHTSFYTITKEDIDKHGDEAIINNDYFKQRRLEMLQGIKHSDCNHCWRMEDQGLSSPRTYGIETIKGYKERYQELISQSTDITEDALKSSSITEISLVMENTCDLKCSYCNNTYSSQWAVEDLKNKVISVERYRELSKESDPVFNSMVNALIAKHGDTIQSFGVTGGEPLIVPNFYELLDAVINSDIKSDSVFYVFTNGNSKNFDKFISFIPSLTDKFKLIVSISIESTGTEAEYSRYGLDWNTLNKNIEQIISIKNDRLLVRISPTINAVCVPTFDKFIEWVLALEEKHNNRIAFFQNIIKFPEHQRPEILPIEFQQPIDRAIDLLKTSKFDKSDYIKFLYSVRALIGSSTNGAIRQKFIDFYDNYDLLRGTNFTETFTELKDFYEHCKNKQQ